MVLRLLGELFVLIGDGSNEYEIADWANARRYEWNECNDEVEDFLGEINLMNEPEFEISILDVLKKGVGILRSEFNKEAKFEEEFIVYNVLDKRYKTFFEVKRDVKYPVLSSLGRLFILIANKANVVDLTKWAFNEYRRIKELNKNTNYNNLLQLLSDLAVMDIPGFEIETSEIINKSINTLELEIMNYS